VFWRWREQAGGSASRPEGAGASKREGNESEREYFVRKKHLQARASARETGLN
jgi:hypothetical protein